MSKHDTSAGGWRGELLFPVKCRVLFTTANYSVIVTSVFLVSLYIWGEGKQQNYLIV